MARIGIYGGLRRNKHADYNINISMKKTTLIIIIAIVILIVAIVAFLIFGQNSSNSSNGNSSSTAGTLPPAVTNVPYAPPSTLPSSTTLTIGTSQGSVTVDNFYTGAKISADRTSALIEKTSAYNITYYIPDSSFNILIEQSPFDAVREQAEAAFLQLLGISQADACKLKVKVGAPISVDPNHAGQNLGLSFCAPGTFSE